MDLVNSAFVRDLLGILRQLYLATMQIISIGV